MLQNLVSAKLSPADRQEIIDAIKTIRDKMPFLVDLTPEERRSLPRMSDKSRAFVRKTLDVATQNQDFLPRSFDLEEMQQDVELFEELYPIWQSLTQLCELVDDTKMAVGSDAYVAALLVYNYAKTSGLGAGLNDVIDDLGKRFARRSRQVATEV